MTQLATLLILAIVATWVTPRLARDLSEPTNGADDLTFGPVGDIADGPDYFDFGPAGDVVYGPDADIYLVPDLAPYNDNAPNESIILNECWNYIGEDCAVAIINGYLTGELKLTHECCQYTINATKKSCWKDMFPSIQLPSSYEEQVKSYCVSGQVAPVPVVDGQ